MHIATYYKRHQCVDVQQSSHQTRNDLLTTTSDARSDSLRTTCSTIYSNTEWITKNDFSQWMLKSLSEVSSDMMWLTDDNFRHEMTHYEWYQCVGVQQSSHHTQNDLLTTASDAYSDSLQTTILRVSVQQSFQTWNDSWRTTSVCRCWSRCQQSHQTWYDLLTTASDTKWLAMNDLSVGVQ